MSFAHLPWKKEFFPCERYSHNDLWRKPHACFSIHAYLLFKNSEIFQTAVAIPTHILCVFSDPQLLETDCCIGYLDVIICDNSSLPGTAPKPPHCVSAQNSIPFAHDCFPYQTCRKQLTLERKKKGLWVSVYRRQPKVQLSLTARLAGDTDRWSPCAEAAQKMLFPVWI